MPHFKTILKSLFQVVIKSLLGLVAAILIGVPCFLFFTQHSLIYHPRSYFSREVEGIPLTYSTSEGHQTAYYIPPLDKSSSLPERIWVMFPGNASVAMDWIQFVKRYPAHREAFLLIDYPGYGNCGGVASPQSIEDSSEAALRYLSELLHLRGDFKLGVIGHSLGCAAGLNFAVRHRVDRLVLVAPFTNLRDMAQRTVGWPLCWLLRHNFDNRARLLELVKREPLPRVDLFHGSADEVIPLAMGKKLASEFPQMITFHEVQEAHHNTILVQARDQIFEAMQKQSGKKSEL